MRVLYTLSAAVVALVLTAPAAPCQGLAEAAAKEAARRKALKPTKVITEGELRGGRGTVSQPGGAEDLAAKPADGTNPDGGTAKPAEGDKPKDPAKKEKTEEEIQAEKAKDWRAKVEQCQAEITRIQTEVDRAQAALGDITGNLYGGGRAATIGRLEAAQKSLRAANDKMAELQEEGRRNRY